MKQALPEGPAPEPGALDAKLDGWRVQPKTKRDVDKLIAPSTSRRIEQASTENAPSNLWILPGPGGPARSNSSVV
jgi:hypothetical protein